MRGLILPILAIALLVVAACGSSPTAPILDSPSPTLSSVTLSVASSSLKFKRQTSSVTAVGTLSNGTTQVVTSTCSNWRSDNVGVLTVDSMGTITAVGSGASTITTTCEGVSARGLVTLSLLPDQVFTFNGTGDAAFDMPTYVTRVHITAGTFRLSSNFMVTVAGDVLVKALIGRSELSTTYDGTLITTGGVVEISNSDGVSWSFTEVR
jgi:hypothetical protein